MARETNITCDRCGCKIESDEYIYHAEVATRPGILVGDAWGNDVLSYELCAKCQELLVHFSGG